MRHIYFSGTKFSILLNFQMGPFNTSRELDRLFFSPGENFSKSYDENQIWSERARAKRERRPLRFLCNLPEKSGAKNKYWQSYSNSTTQMPLTGGPPLYV